MSRELNCPPELESTFFFSLFRCGMAVLHVDSGALIYRLLSPVSEKYSCSVYNKYIRLFYTRTEICLWNSLNDYIIYVSYITYFSDNRKSHKL